MDSTLILLLAALAMVYLAWRAARRQNERLRAERMQQVERRTSTLEPHQSAAGRGYVVLLPDGSRSDEYEAEWGQDGLDIITVEGFPASPEAVVSVAFNSGADVELIPDDTDDTVIWVWDSGMTMRAGRIPAWLVPTMRRRDAAGEIGDCIVLWERMDTGRRTGIDLLVIHRDTPLEA